MKIIEEQPNMITVPVHDYKSEDELKFIASLSMLDRQQKVTPNLNIFTYSEIVSVSFCVLQLFVTSVPALSEYQCKICHFICDNHLALASHQINHQLNHHFCCHGCGFWCKTLEEILEHEYRQHEKGLDTYNCRVSSMRERESETETWLQ